VQIGTRLIKYDPDYSGDDEDEKMEAVEDKDEENEDLGNAYSDDEDNLYTIQLRHQMPLSAHRDATRAPHTILQGSLTSTCAVFWGLSVRLELWATYNALLTQTKHYVGGSSGRADSPDRKCKRTGSNTSTSEVKRTKALLSLPSRSRMLKSQALRRRLPQFSKQGSPYFLS